MKLFELYEKPKTEELRHIKTNCDFCGKESETLEQWYDGTPGLRFTSAALSMKRYPNREALLYDEYSVLEYVDCCGVCWENEVLPWLASKGIKPQGETDVE